MYDRIWTDLKVFCSHVLTISDAQLPVYISSLSLCLAYFHEKGFAASTLCSYNSAIGYFHKLGNYPDPSNTFFILKLLQGAKCTCPSVDCSLPNFQF